MRPPRRDLFDDDSLGEPMASVVRRIGIAGFRSLWSGKALTPPELLDGDTTALAEAVDHLRERGRIELSGDGRVIAVHGLSLRVTRHRIEHRGGSVHTWCALDAIGIPAALGIDARALTRCPTCQSALEVALTGGGPQPDLLAMLWYPEVASGHLVEDFCSGANLFCSLEHLEQWLGANEAAGKAMSVGEVAELGRDLWRESADSLEGPIDGVERRRASDRDGRTGT